MNRQGSVRKDPKKPDTWLFSLDAHQPGAKRRTIVRRGYRTRKLAEAALAETRKQVESGSYVGARNRQQVGAFLDEWLRTVEPSLRQSTAYSYRRNLEQHVIPRIGGLALTEVDGGTLNALYALLAEPGSNLVKPDRGLSRRTINYIATVLGRAFADAERWGRIPRNPAQRADPPKSSGHRKVEQPTWNADEVRSFLARAEAEQDSDATLWRFLVSTGCRRGEALGLRWRDVDLDEGRATIVQTVGVVAHEIVVNAPKTKASVRTVDVDPVTVERLRAHRRAQLELRLSVGRGWRDRDLVFGAADGDYAHPEAVTKRFGRRVRAWGFPPIPLHSLRHTWATLALRAGVHPRVVQEQLGHSTIATTLGVYSHVTEGLNRDAAQTVAALFADGSERP